MIDPEEFDEDKESEYLPEEHDAGVFWCPKCGAEMYGDATRCPRCENYVTPGARTSTPTSWWIWVGLLLIGLALLGGLLAAFVKSPVRNSMY